MPVSIRSDPGRVPARSIEAAAAIIPPSAEKKPMIVGTGTVLSKTSDPVPIKFHSGSVPDV